MLAKLRRVQLHVWMHAATALETITEPLAHLFSTKRADQFPYLSPYHHKRGLALSCNTPEPRGKGGGREAEGPSYPFQTHRRHSAVCMNLSYQLSFSSLGYVVGDGHSDPGQPEVLPEKETPQHAGIRQISRNHLSQFSGFLLTCGSPPCPLLPRAGAASWGRRVKRHREGLPDRAGPRTGVRHRAELPLLALCAPTATACHTPHKHPVQAGDEAGMHPRDAVMRERPPSPHSLSEEHAGSAASRAPPARIASCGTKWRRRSCKMC